MGVLEWAAPCVQFTDGMELQLHWEHDSTDSMYHHPWDVGYEELDVTKLAQYKLKKIDNSWSSALQ